MGVTSNDTPSSGGVLQLKFRSEGMIEIRIFNNSQFGDISTATTENEDPRFCLADNCSISNLQASAVVLRLDNGVISNCPIQDSLGRQQNAYL